VNLAARDRWARALTTAGWLFAGSYVALLIGQIRRAFAIRRASFEDGLWGQRIEVISFASTSQILVMLVPAVAAGVAAVWLTTSEDRLPPVSTRNLVRIVAGICYVAILSALLGIVDVFAQTPDAVGGSIDVLNRLGGIMIAVAMIRVCHESERTAFTGR
jgi:hypothetical protein